MDIRANKDVSEVMRAEPHLLFNAGSFLEDAMRRERVTQDEVTAAVRPSGHDDPSTIRSVVLETDRGMSVRGTDA